MTDLASFGGGREKKMPARESTVASRVPVAALACTFVAVLLDGRGVVG